MFSLLSHNLYNIFLCFIIFSSFSIWKRRKCFIKSSVFSGSGFDNRGHTHLIQFSFLHPKIKWFNVSSSFWHKGHVVSSWFILFLYCRSKVLVRALNRIAESKPLKSFSSSLISVFHLIYCVSEVFNPISSLHAFESNSFILLSKSVVFTRL